MKSIIFDIHTHTCSHLCTRNSILHRSVTLAASVTVFSYVSVSLSSPVSLCLTICLSVCVSVSEDRSSMRMY